MVATSVQLISSLLIRRIGRMAIVLSTVAIVAGCTTPAGDPFRPDAASSPDTPAEPDASAPLERQDVVAGLQQEAWAEQASGNLSAAVSLLERALRIDGSSAELYHQIAEVRLGQGRFADAEQVAAKGLSRVISNPELEAALWRVTAQARSGQGDIEGAREAREQACALGAC